jgi:hypothetical protein
MDDAPKDVRLPLMVSRGEASAIDAWRYSNRVPSRAEAIRRLIAVGLKIEGPVRNLLFQIEERRIISVRPENQPVLDAIEATKRALGDSSS